MKENELTLEMERTMDYSTVSFIFGFKQIAYEGFTYGHASKEVLRFLDVGEHVLNLAGVPLTVPSSVDEKYCGKTFIIYKVDTGELEYIF